ncbi:MAG: hypothetical protein ACK5HP_00725 [Bacilli bacterium]
MKNKLETFKELWNNPRIHALMVLGLYAVFFVIIFIYITISKNTTNQNVEIKDSLETLNNMNSYEYHYKYEINNEITNINGIKYNDINEFSIENNKFTIVNNKIEGEVSIDDKLYILEILPNYIYSYIKLNNNLNETTYSDNTIKKEYIILIKEIKQYFGTESDENITVTTYEEDNQIYKIELDLTNIVEEEYLITINYENINNIINYNSTS